MGRFISLIVLLASIVVIGALFYKVMIGFFVPCFLAAVLVIVFRPLHRWVLQKVGNREHIAAGITTTLIVFSVLLPTALALIIGAFQGTKLVASINPATVRIGLDEALRNLQLDSPCQSIIRAVQRDIDEIQKTVGSMTLSTQVQDSSGAFAGLDRKLNSELDSLIPALATYYVNEVKEQVRQAKDATPDSQAFDATKVEAALQLKAEQEYKAIAADWSPSIKEVKDSLAELQSGQVRDIIELRSLALQLGRTWQHTKETLLGGNGSWLGAGLWASLKEFANPSVEQINDLTKAGIGYLQPILVSATGATAEFLIRLAIGTMVMLVSLYFFLYDGPGMIAALMKLSPLDDRYEMELLIEFDRVARAIVLAMILSAIVQGLTAGIGYYAAGLVDSLLLLTVLSILCGLIPFVGPGVVWVPACVYLSLYLGQHTKAILLAIWGIGAVATVDNIVKAYVLHGHSQLHPLLALLSVLGGVSTLGPIGIVVGPIVVVILQTLLMILQREIIHFDETAAFATAGITAEINAGAMPPDEGVPKQNKKTLSGWRKKLRASKPEPTTKVVATKAAVEDGLDSANLTTKISAHSSSTQGASATATSAASDSVKPTRANG